MTIRNNAILFNYVLFNMGNMVDYSMSFLLLSTQNFFAGQVGGTHEILVSAQGPLLFGFLGLGLRGLGPGLDNNYPSHFIFNQTIPDRKYFAVSIVGTESTITQLVYCCIMLHMISHD